MRELERIFVRVNWLGLTTIALGFALWEVLLRAGFAQYQNLPAPSAIADGLVEITSSGQLLADTLHTLRAVLVGWAAGAAWTGRAFSVIVDLKPSRTLAMIVRRNASTSSSATA